MSKSNQYTTDRLENRIPNNNGLQMVPRPWQILNIFVYLMPTTTTKGTAILPPFYLEKTEESWGSEKWICPGLLWIPVISPSRTEVWNTPPPFMELGSRRSLLGGGGGTRHIGAAFLEGPRVRNRVYRRSRREAGSPSLRAYERICRWHGHRPHLKSEVIVLVW